MGGTVNSETAPVSERARLFGASSPRTMCSAVMMIEGDRYCDGVRADSRCLPPQAVSKMPAQSDSASKGSPRNPRPMLAMVIPSCVAARIVVDVRHRAQRESCRAGGP